MPDMPGTACKINTRDNFSKEYLIAYYNLIAEHAVDAVALSLLLISVVFFPRPRSLNTIFIFPKEFWGRELIRPLWFADPVKSHARKTLSRRDQSVTGKKYDRNKR